MNEMIQTNQIYQATQDIIYTSYSGVVVVKTRYTEFHHSHSEKIISISFSGQQLNFTPVEARKLCELLKTRCDCVD